MKSKIIFIVSLFIALNSLQVNAGAADGNWMFQKDNTDALQRSVSIHGISLQSLISTAEGVAWETGWWTENGGGTNGRTRVVVSIAGEPAENIEYKLNGSNSGEIWMTGSSSRWGTMTRTNCSLTMMYRKKSDVPSEGCAWLKIRGWGYSALDGECMYNKDWENLPGENNGPMDCLIEAPSKMAQ